MRALDLLKSVFIFHHILDVCPTLSRHQQDVWILLSIDLHARFFSNGCFPP